MSQLLDDLTKSLHQVELILRVVAIFLVISVVPTVIAVAALNVFVRKEP
jgi:hypothetical protein